MLRRALANVLVPLARPAIVEAKEDVRVVALDSWARLRIKSLDRQLYMG